MIKKYFWIFLFFRDFMSRNEKVFLKTWGRFFLSSRYQHCIKFLKFLGSYSDRHKMFMVTKWSPYGCRRAKFSRVCHMDCIWLQWKFCADRVQKLGIFRSQCAKNFHGVQVASTWRPRGEKFCMFASWMLWKFCAHHKFLDKFF